MNKRDVIICSDADELCRRAAAEFVARAGQSVQERGRFSAALSGGSTPRALYSLLAAAQYSRQISWPRVHLFWGDERCVPPDHPDSNYRMVRETLLSKITIPPENVHRMAGEQEPGSAAAAYEARLRAFFRLSGNDWPRFDLIFLGLGEDGHTASLFPESSALGETRRLVTASYVGKLKAHRLTLTLPVLNNGAAVLFLIAGSNKADIVRQILRADDSPGGVPAARVQPVDGRLIWFVARDAAPR